MREEERIREGLLFCPADPELKRMKLRTHNLNLDYNKPMSTKPKSARRCSGRCWAKWARAW